MQVTLNREPVNVPYMESIVKCYPAAGIAAWLIDHGVTKPDDFMPTSSLPGASAISATSYLVAFSTSG